MVYSWADNLGLFQCGVFPTSSNIKLNKRADYVSRWMPPMEISVPGSVFQCFLSVRQKANILQKGSFLERSQFFHPDVLWPNFWFQYDRVCVTAMRLHKNSEQVTFLLHDRKQVRLWNRTRKIQHRWTRDSEDNNKGENRKKGEKVKEWKRDSNAEVKSNE